MALNSKIEWTDHTWNPWVGCEKVSPGCDHCYMFRSQKRFGKDPTEIRRTSKATWNQVKKFKAGDKVFVCSWSDFFHHGVPEEWRNDAMQVMDDRPDVTWIILTKRPNGMLAWSHQMEPWLVHRSNVWLGVTAENQEQADKRIPILLQIPASVRFVSVEPMLGPVDMSKYLLPHCPTHDFNSGFCLNGCPDRRPGLDWVICGGESGPGARPMHTDWVRSLRDQCQAAGVPFFFKQWGEWAPVGWCHAGSPAYNNVLVHPAGIVFDARPMRSQFDKLGHSRWYEMKPAGKKKAGRNLDGRTWDQFPEER